MSSQQSPANLQSSVDRDKIYQWIIELSNPETRENALLELRYSASLHLQLLVHAFLYLSGLILVICFIYLLTNTHSC
jgi:CCR4-NOT transcription complex subunit 9